MAEGKIIANLTDYLSVNNGKVSPDREVTFIFYSFKEHQNLGTSTFIQFVPVTRVRKHSKGFSGRTKEGKRIVVSEANATINMPLSILKEK